MLSRVFHTSTSTYLPTEENRRSCMIHQGNLVSGASISALHPILDTKFRLVLSRSEHTTICFSSGSAPQSIPKPGNLNFDFTANSGARQLSAPQPWSRRRGSGLARKVSSLIGGSGVVSPAGTILNLDNWQRTSHRSSHPATTLS